MRSFNLFSLIIMMASAFFAWNAVAAPMTVHVLENLSPEEHKQAMALIQQKGFIPSKKPLFEESSAALIITKTIKTESDEPSVQIELVEKKGERDLPKTRYVVSFPTDRVVDAIRAFPHSDQLSDSRLMPVAYQR